MNPSVEFLRSVQISQLRQNFDRNLFLRQSFSSLGQKLGISTDIMEAVMWEGLMASIFKDVREWFKKDLKNYFSPLDNNLDKFKMWFASQAVQMVLPSYKLAIPQVVFGTFPMRYVNAHCIPSPYGGHVIAFNRGTFDFIENMTIVFSSCFKRVQDEDKNGRLMSSYEYCSKEEISKNHFVNIKFIETLSSYLLDLPIKRIPLPSINKDLLIGVRNYSAASYIFIMAHEYAHIICNHKNVQDEDTDPEKIIERLRVLPSGESIHEVVPNSWIREYEADEIAFKLTFTYLNQTHDLLTAFFGIEFFLAMMRICDIIEDREDLIDYTQPNGMVTEKNYWEKTHSIARDRLNRIMQLVQKLFPNECNEMFRESRLFFKPWEYLFEINQEAIQTLKVEVANYRKELVKEQT